jgi:hypothetical protein
VRRLATSGLVAFIAVLSLLAAACSSSKGKSEGTTVPSTSTVPASVGSSAAETTAPATTAPARSSVGYPTPRQAAQHLVDAWRRSDRSAALQGADASAVEQMFTAPPPNGSIYECDKGDSSPSYCGVQVYGAQQLYVRLEMVQRPVGWVVDLADVESLH